MTLWQANTDPGSSTRPPLPVLESQNQTKVHHVMHPTGDMRNVISGRIGRLSPSAACLRPAPSHTISAPQTPVQNVPFPEGLCTAGAAPPDPPMYRSPFADVTATWNAPFRKSVY